MFLRGGSGGGVVEMGCGRRSFDVPALEIWRELRLLSENGWNNWEKEGSMQFWKW